MKITFLLILAVFQVSISQGQNIPKLNTLIPNTSEEWVFLKGKENKSAKLTVIDFWATWCAPCIAAFPHLNSLQQKYKNDLQIIALSDENPAVIKNFLTRYKIDFAVATDFKKKTFDYFKVNGRPMTILLDEKKKFIWIGESEKLDTVIERYLKNKVVNTDNISSHPLYSIYTNNVTIKKPSQHLFDLFIDTAKTDDPYFARTQKNENLPVNIKYQNISIREIVQDLMNTSRIRTRVHNDNVNTTFINVEAKSASPRLTLKLIRPVMVAQLEALFNFSVVSRDELTDVNILETDTLSSLYKQANNIEGGGSIQNDNNIYKAIRISLPQLADFLESKYGQPIDVNTDVSQKFDLEFAKRDSFDEVKNELLIKYGLKFRKEKKGIKIIFIE